tara:strand:- start:3237 stop:3539 length:303 start_codon:yes stop_codon:yes gene_type:complete
MSFLNRIDSFAGDSVKLLADLTALGIVAFSVRPIFNTIKNQEWDTLPLIGVPFLLGTFVLAARSGHMETNYVDVSDAIDIVRDDISDLYEDVVGPDMEMM